MNDNTTTCGAVTQSLCHPSYPRTTRKALNAYVETWYNIQSVTTTSNAAIIVNSVWYGAIFLFGITGAIFTMIVLWKDRDLRKSVFYRILFVEAFFEGLACFGSGVGHGSNSGWWTTEQYRATTIYGKVVHYETCPNWLFWILQATTADFYRMGDVAAYLLLIMSADRFCGTLFPVKYHVIMTKKGNNVVFWVAMTITALAFFLEIEPFRNVPIIGYKEGINGTLDMEYRVFHYAWEITNSELVKNLIQFWSDARNYTNWVKMPIIMIFLPLSSILIAMRLRKMEVQNDDYNRKRNAFRMLAITSTLTVLLYIPRIIYTVLMKVTNDWRKDPMTVTEAYYTWRNVANIVIKIVNWMEVTYALNFYLMYGLTRNFRKSANKYLFKKKDDGNGSAVTKGTQSQNMASKNAVHPRVRSPTVVQNANEVQAMNVETEL